MSTKIKVLLVKVGEEVQELSIKDGGHLKFFKKHLNIQPKEGEGFWKEAMKGNEEIPGEDIPKDQQARFKQVIKLITWHDAEEARREKEKVKAVELAKKEGEKLVLAVHKGRALGGQAMPTITNFFQKILGSGFEVTDAGCKPTKNLTEAELGQALSAMLECGDGLKKAQATNEWVIGDLLVEAEKKGKDPIALASQIATASGQDKWTVKYQYDIAKEFPFDERMPGLFRSHYKEAFDAMRTEDPVTKKKVLTHAKAKAILEKALAGEMTVNVTTGEGDNVQQRRPWSVAKTREELNKITGKVKKEKDSNGDAPSVTTKPHTIEAESEVITPECYLWIDGEGEVYKSDKMSLSALAKFPVVIDLKSNCRVYPDNEGYEVEGEPIEDLGDEWFQDEEEEPVKPAAKKAAKKAAKAVAEVPEV